MKEALFYKKEPLSKVRCVLCPHRCQLGKGKQGICRTRENQEGVLVSSAYGQVGAYALDPVEKKPFSHLLPGSRWLSYGAPGCTLHCPFCANHALSQEAAPTVELGPEALASLALQHGAQGVCATYSEPVAFYEFVEDTAWAARDRGLKAAVVTNGYINEEPLKHWLASLDAIKVDLKGGEVFYREVAGGQLEPALRTIRMAQDAGTHVEVSFPLFPTFNDQPEEMEGLFKRMAEISPELPLHILATQAAYKVSLEEPGPAALTAAWELARKHLRYVYVRSSSASPAQQATHCPACGVEVLARDGLTVTRNRLNAGRCPDCSAALPGIWA